MESEEKREAFAQKLIGAHFDFEERRQLFDKIAKGAHYSKEPIKHPLYHPKEERTLPENVACYPSTCFSCHNTCECLVYCDKTTGKILRVEGDPESPQTHGRFCSKGLSASELCYDPKRILHPLKRIGKRGEGKFKEISWDEALDTIAEKMTSYKEQYGPESVAFLEGTRRGWSRVFSRFANSFGSPNHGAAGWAQCLWPRLIDITTTFGRKDQYPEVYDFKNADVILCWGINPATCWGNRAGDIMDAKQRGCILIAVDPFLSETAAKADIWLQLRPGTDTALALTMLHVIFEENLEDSDFLTKYTFGWEELKKSVLPYTPEWGESITGVPSEQIIKAAEIYAKANSSSLVRCLGVDETHDSYQTARATSCLIAVTGNIGKPGSNNLCSSRGEISQNSLKFILNDRISEKKKHLRAGYYQFPLLTQDYSPVPCMHMPTFWQQVLSGKPYKIPCILIFGSNAAVNYTNTSIVQKALCKVEFLAVSDLFMTPTCKYADIVLPASSWLERNNVISSFQTDNENTLFQQKIVQIGESKNDVDIICQLAKRLGLEKDFWKDSEEMYDWILKPTGETFKTALAKRRLYKPMQYYQYTQRKFDTPTGKIELYSTRAAEKGVTPLPCYSPSPQSILTTPELAKEFPLTMTTGRHETAFRHTENRSNPYLLELCPLPFIDINPETAKKYNIKNGQKVKIESVAGHAYAYARYTLGIRTDVVQGIPGWWGENNINLVVPWGKYAEGDGTVCCRGFLCRIEPVMEQ